MASKKPDIKITKIFSPNKDAVRECRVKDHGHIECWFTVNGVKYVLHYNPKLAGYRGMPAEARENCSFVRECDGKQFNCTTQYAIPDMPRVEAYERHTSDFFGKDKAVDSFMDPTEKMLLDTFIRPFVKDYDIADSSAKTDADNFWEHLTGEEKDSLIAVYKAIRCIVK